MSVCSAAAAAQDKAGFIIILAAFGVGLFGGVLLYWKMKKKK